MHLKTSEQFKKDLFTLEQREQLKALLIDSGHEYFFHVSLKRNKQNIVNNGLLVKHSNPEMLAYGSPSCLCYCTQDQLPDVRRMLSGRVNYDESELITIKISSSIFLSKNFGLDWSCSQVFNNWQGIYEEYKLDQTQVTDIIKRGGFLVCYDDIPPDMFELH